MMTIRTRTFSTLGVLALGLSLTAPMHGAEGLALHTNRLTFGGAVRLPGVTLTAGSYLFERVEATNPDVIVVRSDDRTKVYYMAATRRADRPAGLDRTRLVTFGEARRGEVPPITAWYPDGEQNGHAFVYAAR
jgi:hypothetical protein